MPGFVAKAPESLGRRTRVPPQPASRVSDIHDPRRLTPVLVFQEPDASETERRLCGLLLDESEDAGRSPTRR